MTKQFQPGDRLMVEPRYYDLIGPRDIFGPPGRRFPPHVMIKDGDFAYGVWHALAVTLAAPLRKALEDHLDEHGCGAGSGPTYIGGFIHCPEAKRLFELLPDGDRVLIA